MPNPQKPQGTSKEAAFMIWVWEQLTGWMQPLSSPTVGITRTTRGWYADVKQTSGGTSTPGPARSTLFELHGDYLICKLFGTQTQVKVAKTPWLRSSITSETIWGVGVTYTNAAYTAPDKYQRRDAMPDAGVTEKQVIYPYYKVGQEIWITPITPFDTADSASVSVTYIEAHSRVWLRKLDQST